MMRALDVVEKNVVDDDIPPLVVPDSIATNALPDTTNMAQVGEVAYLEIFNAGANKCYYKYGADCNPNAMFNAFIAPGQMLEVKTRQRVSVFSPGGTTLSFTRLMRKDYAGGAFVQ